MNAANVAELPRRDGAGDPSAESRWSAFWISWHTGYALDLGRAEGWRQCEREYRAAWRADVAAGPHPGRDRDREAIECARWLLLCPACRVAGAAPGCAACEPRTAATFAAPMLGDWLGGGL
ncbi:MAG TPA: hypothetical protein VIX86_04565 [Streptosporangiaceae bacterium]